MAVQLAANLLPSLASFPFLEPSWNLLGTADLELQLQQIAPVSRASRCAGRSVNQYTSRASTPGESPLAALVPHTDVGGVEARSTPRRVEPALYVPTAVAARRKAAEEERKATRAANEKALQLREIVAKANKDIKALQVRVAEQLDERNKKATLLAKEEILLERCKKELRETMLQAQMDEVPLPTERAGGYNSSQ